MSAKANLTANPEGAAGTSGRPFSRLPGRLTVGRVAMGVLYLGAGSLHFLLTRAYTGIMPSYLPAHRELVLLSGAAEVLGGAGVLIPATRRYAAWGLVVLLVAVFPANLTMITEHHRFPTVPLWAAWLRLPLQLPLIYWAWLYTRTLEA